MFDVKKEKKKLFSNAAACCSTRLKKFLLSIYMLFLCSAFKSGCVGPTEKPITSENNC